METEGATRRGEKRKRGGGERGASSGPAEWTGKLQRDEVRSCRNGWLGLRQGKRCDDGASGRWNARAAG